MGVGLGVGVGVAVGVEVGVDVGVGVNVGIGVDAGIGVNVRVGVAVGSNRVHAVITTATSASSPRRKDHLMVFSFPVRVPAALMSVAT